MKMLSIVVPAYNVEKYLEQCLQSFEVSEILDKIEILIINDGSKDHTAEIAQRYCDKHPNSYFLYNKENGGHGSGINYGIKYATGKYFKVVDGDDWLNSQELTDFILLLERVDTDIVATDFLCIQDETQAVLSEKHCTPDTAQYGQTIHLDEGGVQDVIKMHALTIKTDILQSHDIVIDEKCFYVDCEYITYPIPYVKTVYFYNRYIYMYRLGRNGQSMDIKSMQRNRAQHMRVLESLLHFYDTMGEVSESTRKYIERCIAQVVENQFQIYISMGLQKGIYDEMKTWDAGLRKTYLEIYKATTKKSIWLLRKTNYIILPIGYVVYNISKNID